MKIPENLVSLISAPISVYPNAVSGLVAEVLSRLKTGQKAEMPKCLLMKMSASGMTCVEVEVDDDEENDLETDDETSVEGNKQVLIIPVMKFISKQDIEEYGILGTATIQKLIASANANPNIAGVILHINNPGGTVMNTPETSTTIFENIKPIVAYVEDLGASSGYYLAMACKFIFLAGRTTMVGNIGTKSQGIDLSGILAKYGAERWEIFAKESFDKDLGFKEALAGNPEKYQESLLAPFAKMFMDDARLMRPSIPEDALHGMVYVGEAAIEKGLADAIGSMDDAVMKVLELSNNTPQSEGDQTSNQINNNMKKVIMSFPASLVGAAKALGGEEVTGEAGGATGDLQAALTAIKKSSADEITALGVKLTEAQGKLTTAEGTITALEKDKTTLTGEITTLKASSPAGARSAARTDAENAKEKIEGEGNLIQLSPEASVAQSKIDALVASFGL